MLYKALLGLHKVALHLTQKQNNLSCKGPLEIIRSNLFLKAEPALKLEPASKLDQVAQGHIQSSFEYLQGQRFRNLSGQPIPVLDHPYFEKNVFLYHVL